MRQIAQAMVALAMIALLAACQATDNGAALQVSPDNPQIFRVGGEFYTLAEYKARLNLEVGAGIESMLQEGQTPAQIEDLANQSNVRGSILDRMIQDALLMHYARGHGIGVDAAAVDQAVAAQAPMGAPSAADRLGVTQNLLVLEVLARNTRADMFHARKIQVASEAEADAILTELASGADFATLAKERSQDATTADDGGDLGWMPRGDLPAELDTAGFEQPLNTPAKVQVGDSWHVIEVLERQAGETAAEKRPFDSFNQLQSSQGGQQFYEETFLPWYDQLRIDAEASGDLVLAEGFDPNSVPLPFPAQ